MTGLGGAGEVGEAMEGVGTGGGSKEKRDGEGAIKERYWSTT